MRQPGPIVGVFERYSYTGQGWELVGEGYRFSEGPAVNAAGEVFYQDIPNAKTYKVGLDGKVIMLKLDSKKAGGTAFGPNGFRYTAATATSQVLSYDTKGNEKVVADGIACNDLTVANNENIYVTAPDGTENRAKYT